MSKRKPAQWAALLAAAALALVVPGVARSEDLSELFPVHFGTRMAWYGKYSRTRITGEIRNDSGHAADHLRLVIDGLNVKGYVITRVYRSVDATIPAGGRASFEAEVRSAPSYRVYVDHLETPEAP
jgi:hypothetical protein